MSYYKDHQNNIHYIEPEFAHLLPTGCIAITQEEADAIRIAAIPPVDQKAVILARINALDPIDQLRPMRDGLIYLSIKEGAALGLTEPQIYAVNIGYRRMKDREAELEVLRQQLKALP